MAGKLLGSGSFITDMMTYWSSPASRAASPVWMASFMLT